MADGEGPDLTQKGRAPSPEEVERLHQNADTDARKEAIHHTLGASENQASPGNHNHRGGDSVQLLGGVSITHGLLPTGQRLCAALPGDAPLREGEELRLGIAPADVHVFDASGAVMRRTQAPALAA